MTTTNSRQGAWYTVMCGGFEYTIPVRYQALAHRGKGTFGAVVQATDTTTGHKVAIKKIFQPFYTKIHAKRTYRELKLLMYLNHPNAEIVKLLDVFTPEEHVNEFETLYFVLNFIDYDLSRFIRRTRPLAEDLIQQIIFSLLRGLKFIHSAGVFHRDLKPSNIGIDKNCDVSILDFGLATVVTTGVRTEYVSTRWWRAPDIFINQKKYDEKVDVWSIGCVMAELILLRPIFCGENAVDQLHKIIDIVGTPDMTKLQGACTPESLAYISQMSIKPKKDFNELFGFKLHPETQQPISGVSPTGIDLLDRLLTFDYRERPTAEEALKHPYLEKYYDSEDELTRAVLIDEHQNADYSVLFWKTLVWQLIQDFTPPTWVNDDNSDDQ